MAKIEPYTDCVKLNPNLTQNFWLKRLVFFGYFLGWSLRTMGGLGLDLPPCFWNRICGGPDYVYTMEDLKQMDKYRYDDLQRITDSKETCPDDETFALYFDGYMFEADFGKGSVPLCEGGLEKPLQKSNIEEYVKLYLRKYTEQEDLQYRCLM